MANNINSNEVFSFQETAQQVQALLTLSGIDAGPIDGLEGPKTRHGMSAYAAANNLPEDVGIEEIHTHMMSRLESDPAFFETIKNAAVSAIVGNADTIQNIKATQAYFNAVGYTDNDGHALVVDGKAPEAVNGTTSKTYQALDKLTTEINERYDNQNIENDFDDEDLSAADDNVKSQDVESTNVELYTNSTSDNNNWQSNASSSFANINFPAEEGSGYGLSIKNISMPFNTAASYTVAPELQTELTQDASNQPITLDADILELDLLESKGPGMMGDGFSM